MNYNRPIIQYRSYLTPDQIAVGMNAARENAKRILADAKVLLENGSHATASSLAILAIEEAGKLSCLRMIATAKDGKQLKEAWRRYRDHKAKNAAWIILDLFRSGAKSLDELGPLFDPKSDHPVILDVVKQLGFYTDCYENAHWSEPRSVVDYELAKSMITVADILTEGGTITAREIELWVEFVGPHSEQNLMREGLVNFFKAMKKEGLSTHSEETIETFCRQRNLQ